MELIEGLKWRYATKKFDPTKKISTDDLEKLKEAVQLSASSYGLQLYKILIVEDPAIRAKLKEASWGQSQITDASQVFVFCNYTKANDSHVDEYLDNIAKTINLSREMLVEYEGIMKNTINSQTADVQNVWTAKQTYIALGTLLAAASEMRIDTCPMEGFDNEKYNEILGLTDQNLNAAVIATIGYRAEDDHYQMGAKVRKPQNKLYEVI